MEPPCIYSLVKAVLGRQTRCSNAKPILGRAEGVTRGSWKGKGPRLVWRNPWFGRPGLASNRLHPYPGGWQVGPKVGCTCLGIVLNRLHDLVGPLIRVQLRWCELVRQCFAPWIQGCVFSTFLLKSLHGSIFQGICDFDIILDKYACKICSFSQLSDQIDGRNWYLMSVNSNTPIGINVSTLISSSW